VTTDGPGRAHPAGARMRHAALQPGTAAARAASASGRARVDRLPVPGLALILLVPVGIDHGDDPPRLRAASSPPREDLVTSSNHGDLFRDLVSAEGPTRVEADARHGARRIPVLLTPAGAVVCSPCLREPSLPFPHRAESGAQLVAKLGDAADRVGPPAGDDGVFPRGAAAFLAGIRRRSGPFETRGACP